MAKSDIKQNELFNKMLPVLNTKVRELKREKFTVNSLDIWNYCVINIWNKKKNLHIYEIADDILNVDLYSLSLYIKKEESKDRSN